MNLEHVSVESHRLVPSRPSSHDELKPKAAYDNDCRGDAERSASDGLLKKVRDLGLPLVSVSPVELDQVDHSDVKS
jgi:hypothetical protein